MKRRLWSSVFVAALVGIAATFALSSPAGAAGMSVTVGSPIQVANRLLVTVPVNVVCDPLDGTPIADNVSVQIEQVNGKSVSSGQATLSGGPASPVRGDTFLTCDGTTVNTLNVKIVGSGPFHGGGAIVSASASHAVGSCTFFCTTTASESASPGPTPVNLRGGG